MSDIKEEIEENLNKILSEESPTDVEDSKVEAVVKLSEFEQKMVDKGWDPNGKKSAEEWLDAGFEIRGKKIGDLYKTVDYLKSYVDRQEKDSYTQALNDLKAQKREAVELSDVKRYEALEEQQKRLNPEVNSAVDNFKQKHSEWLDGTSYQAQKMQEVCFRKDEQLTAKNLPPNKHLEILENYMIGEFPDYFKESGLNSTPLVEGKQDSVVRSSKKDKFTFDDLNDVQKKIARTLADKKIMTVENYIKDLVKQGDLK